MKSLLFLGAMVGSALTSLGVDDPINEYPERLIEPLPRGAVGQPFGESVVVQGKVVEGPFMDESSGSEGRLLVQRINGVATQQGLLLRFHPITRREWWHETDHPQDNKLWEASEIKLKSMQGKSFEMRGYEQGAHQGLTGEEFGIQMPVQSGHSNFG